MIIIPDVHGRSFWKSAVNGREEEEILFLGDYVDPYYHHEDLAPWDGMTALLEIIAFKKQHMNNVTLLLGNHDLSYLSKHFPKCRFDYENAEIIHRAILDNLSLFQIAYQKIIAGKRYIFTHAGILPSWLNENEMILGRADSSNIAAILNREFSAGNLYDALGNISEYRGGQFESGSCVWADVREHIELSERSDTNPLHDVFQIFGHTYQEGGKPIITDLFACLDCSRSFFLDDEGHIS